MQVTSVVQVFQALKYRIAGRNEPLKKEEMITQMLWSKTDCVAFWTPVCSLLVKRDMPNWNVSGENSAIKPAQVKDSDHLPSKSIITV